MKKILILSAAYPYPVNNGKRVVLSGVIDLFNQKGFKVDYLYLGHHKPDNQGKIENFIFIEKPKSYQQIKNVLFQSFFMRKKSIQESVLYSNSIKKKIIDIMEKISPDIIFIDTLRLGQFLEDMNKTGKEFLYLDDLFSLRYARMLQAMDRHDLKINLLGNFSSMIPAFARKLLKVERLGKLILKFEKKTIEKREIQIVQSFSNSLLINQSESLALTAKSGAHVGSIKPLMNINVLTERNYSNSPEFIFLGDLTLPHNSFSILFFIEECISKLTEKLPGVKLRLIGKGASQELLEVVNTYPDNVSVEGYVDDLASLFSSACAMIVPLQFGSGVKLKTLEALAHGLPVVSTSYGVEGIAINEYAGCVVEEDIQGFVEAMKRLTCTSYNRQLSAQAISFYKDNYSQDVIFSEYSKIFNLGE
ncbi:glycosyltransferase family 4 protein [Piscirickettsia salmonis]|uniref:glycosyltransferase family 4 protein n=1 Tax=Piscirickettsia salmonis TaxID=1238 RepID=UPI003751633C